MATAQNSKRLLILTILILGPLMVAACSGNSPTAPTPPPPPPPPSCQTNNTADIAFINGLNLTTTVRWDGSIIATLGPGQSTSPITAAAGTPHRLDFLIANTGVIACTGTPVLAQCSNTTQTCR